MAVVGGEDDGDVDGEIACALSGANIPKDAVKAMAKTAYLTVCAPPRCS